MVTSRRSAGCAPPRQSRRLRRVRAATVFAAADIQNQKEEKTRAPGLGFCGSGGRNLLPASLRASQDKSQPEPPGGGEGHLRRCSGGVRQSPDEDGSGCQDGGRTKKRQTERVFRGGNMTA
jgi:hypothetical protein